VRTTGEWNTARRITALMFNGLQHGLPKSVGRKGAATNIA
jgi:hypothetical protein